MCEMSQKRKGASPPGPRRDLRRVRSAGGRRQEGSSETVGPEESISIEEKEQEVSVVSSWKVLKKPGYSNQTEQVKVVS